MNNVEHIKTRLKRLLLFRGMVSSIILIMGFASCSSLEDNYTGSDLYSAFDFSDGLQGWIGGFSGYPTGLEDSLELFSGYSAFPNNLGLNKKTLTISGKNSHKSLFYFVKKKVEALRPNTTYQVFIDAQFIVESRDGIPGDGAIYVKYGAFNDDPEVEELAVGQLPEDKVNTINVDIGMTPAGEGTFVRSVGALELPVVGDSKIFKASNVDRRIVAQTDKDGSLWLLVGFDSTVDAHLAFYFQTISIYYSEI